ncbi:hypothetical protein [Jeotgalibaca sp. A122]|uniref:hypothetical protein n=1 Tax=Jeotgalibaca sp. A122 TaxID=3457322 RepID=UPI003FD1797B
MGIENKMNDLLNNNPVIKKVIKRVYQRLMYTVSPKLKSEGELERISPKDGYEYFFGYYDKSPWDATDRYMLSLRAKNTYSDVAPSEPAEIVIFDTHHQNSFEVIGKTKTWNVQQGCMLQWLGPDYQTNIIYNDFKDNQYCSVIYNVKTKQERILSMPVYNVAQDGSFALSLDFSRLHRMRKGYGYANLDETTKNELLPQSPAIWKVDLKTGISEPLLTYADFANFESTSEMQGAEHKVNHLMLNPSGDRFMVLHRWFVGGRKFTRLVTVGSDGKEFYNLSDDGMVSHCFWKNDKEIIGFLKKKKEGNGYYLMEDQSGRYTHLFEGMTSDGHPSYSPNKDIIVTDTYPDRSRVAKVLIATDGQELHTIAKVFAPFKYDNDVRCDLHPRWNRSGNAICIDSVYEGSRGLYRIPVPRKYLQLAEKEI